MPSISPMSILNNTHIPSYIPEPPRQYLSPNARPFFPSSYNSSRSGQQHASSCESQNPTLLGSQQQQDLMYENLGNRKTNLFIFYLPSSATEKQLRALFQPFGQVLSVHIPKKEGNKGKGYGFVQYRTESEAHHAITAMDGFHWNGKYLRVSLKTMSSKYRGVKIARGEPRVGPT